MLSLLLAQAPNIVGLIGVFLILSAYFLLQIDRLSPDSVTFSLANTIGSSLILISLMFTWNLASGVIEIAWLSISCFGLVKSLYFKFRKR